MSIHGNSKKSKLIHHLYMIYDFEENMIFKFGISDKPINSDGSSKRMREQIDYLNRAVGWQRYSAIILINNIDGRIKALEIEDQHIEAYRVEYGQKPRGNR
jgi:hypothetical protein